MVLLPIWPDASETHPIQSNSRYRRICPEPYDRFLTFPPVHRVILNAHFGSRLCENVGWVRILMD